MGTFILFAVLLTLWTVFVFQLGRIIERDHIETRRERERGVGAKDAFTRAEFCAYCGATLTYQVNATAFDHESGAPIAGKEVKRCPYSWKAPVSLKEEPHTIMERRITSGMPLAKPWKES